MGSSLSSGYAASATRSVSGTIPRSTGEEISSPLTTITSNSASTSGPRRNRVVAPPPTTYVSAAAESGANGTGQKRGKMLYAYEARDQGEISLPEGAEIKIVEPDDGGWTKVHAGRQGGPGAHSIPRRTTDSGRYTGNRTTAVIV